MINTYDNAEKATYDVEELGEYFRGLIELEEQKKRTAIAKAESYFQGFNDAVRSIASIMEASNYRAKPDEPKGGGGE